MGHVPHPTMKDLLVAVNVPTTAKVGQAMLVPLPSGAPKPVEVVEPDAPQAAKVAAGTAGVAVVGGLAVAGAVLGEHIAEDGWDATIAELGDVTSTVGDGIADGASHVADFASDAAGSVEDFIMDLF